MKLKVLALVGATVLSAGVFAGKSGYMPPILAGLTPTVVFGIYGIYLLKKAG